MQIASFDNYAQSYDEHFTFTPIGLLQRQSVYNYLFSLLNKEDKVLELNCGTGYDAVHISQFVKSILAVDASKKMIEVAQERSNTIGVNNLHFEAKLIQELESEIGNSNFVFSNFGGLNCLSPQEIRTFAYKCCSLLPKHSNLFFVIMGTNCLWEKLYFLMKSDKKNASRRRQTDGINTTINNTAFKTYYYSPKQMESYFQTNFKSQKVAPIGLFVPPSYLNPFFGNKPRLLKFLNTMDKLFCKFKWTANYADHYLIHLKKIK